MPANDSLASTRHQTTPGLILPLIVVLVVAMFFPDVAESYVGDGWEKPGPSQITSETWWYLGMVGLQLALGGAVLAWFWPVYRAEFPWSWSPWSVVIGTLGVIVWVLLAQPGWEGQLLQRLGWDASRPSFNPFSIPEASIRNVFLGLRFSVLVLLIPMAEELFLRGWLLRWLESPDYQSKALADLSWSALPLAAVYGVVTHPGEALAAIAWFSMVTWLMWRTGSLWDCVIAHAVTNLLLGVYILGWSQWQLW